MNESKKRAVTFLRLVEPQAEPLPLSKADLTRPSWRSTLFANEHPNLLTFVNFERTTETDFLTLVTAGKPRFVIDLRLAPRFDLGALNRRLVFSLFEQGGIRYVDMSGHLQLTDRRDARLNPAFLVESLKKFAFRTDRSVEGPVIFLVDALQFEESYIRQLLEWLPSAYDDGWDVLRIPYPAKKSHPADLVDEQKRDVVFISHANPQDNTFVIWLAARLASEGYAVWTDVTKLLGGEEFWETIEDAIRNFSAKVVVVLSRTSQTKKNVLDEINLAVSVERSVGLDGFVVPLRIDDLPFDQVRANLARKNIIDFKDNWAAGLGQLVKAFERDGVPKVASLDNSMLVDWAATRFRSHGNVIPKSEQLISNWLPISSLPEDIKLYDVAAPIERLDEIARSLPYPTFRYLRLVGSFAELADLQSRLDPATMLTEQYRIGTPLFLTGGQDAEITIPPRQAQNLTLNMLRQAWDLRMVKQGLIAFEMASRTTTWFVPKGLMEGDQATFIDANGKRRRRSLVGWSQRRQMFWHFGIEAKPVLGEIPRFVLKQHVIFTADGKTPIGDKDRMHTLRRRFCRSWWNDRWRDLLLAFVSSLFEENKILLSTGDSAAIELQELVRFDSLVSSEDMESEEASGSLEIQDELDSEDDLEDEMTEDAPASETNDPVVP